MGVSRKPALAVSSGGDLAHESSLAATILGTQVLCEGLNVDAFCICCFFFGGAISTNIQGVHMTVLGRSY